MDVTWPVSIGVQLCNKLFLTFLVEHWGVVSPIIQPQLLHCSMGPHVGFMFDYPSIWITIPIEWIYGHVGILTIWLLSCEHFPGSIIFLDIDILHFCLHKVHYLGLINGLLQCECFIYSFRFRGQSISKFWRAIFWKNYLIFMVKQLGCKNFWLWSKIPDGWYLRIFK